MEKRNAYRQVYGVKKSWRRIEKIYYNWKYIKTQKIRCDCYAKYMKNSWMNAVRKELREKGI